MNTERWLLLGAGVLNTGGAASLALADNTVPLYVKLILAGICAGAGFALAQLRNWGDARPG